MPKTYKIAYTEKFPYRYFVEFPSYTVSTTRKASYNFLLSQIVGNELENPVTDLDVKMVNKLLVAGFTVVKNK